MELSDYIARLGEQIKKMPDDKPQKVIVNLGPGLCFKPFFSVISTMTSTRQRSNIWPFMYFILSEAFFCAISRKRPLQNKSY